MEELLKTHRQQQKTLQGQITQKKKSATKKTRKSVNDECIALEQALAEEQRLELVSTVDSLKLSDNDNQNTPQVSQSAGTGDNASQGQTEDPPENGIKKPNRQQARKARKAAEQDAAIAQAKAEAASMPDRRQQEITAMQEVCQKLHLQEHGIRPDGHCLYSAVAHQLKHLLQTDHDYRTVRKQAAHYIEQHPDDFLPFLELPLSDYVTTVRDTAEWGGHLELVALAKYHSIQINVLQASGHVENVTGQQHDKAFWLAYYRHSHGLGEHYNSLVHLEP